MSYSRRHASTKAVHDRLKRQLAEVSTAKAAEDTQQTSLAVAVSVIRLTSEDYKAAEKSSGGGGGGGDDMWSEMARRAGYAVTHFVQCLRAMRTFVFAKVILIRFYPACAA